MRWLLIEMWFYLGVAFLLGMAAYRWIFGGGGGGVSAEEVSAELASVRTRHQEAEAERARLRAKVVELNSQLEEARRQVRSAAAEAHAARLEIGADEAAARAAAIIEPSVDAAQEPAAPAQPPSAERPAPAPLAAAPVSSVPPVGRPGSFMEILKEGGAPDDLTRIKGIGAKLEQKLNTLGVYYFRQIAGWTEGEVAEMDKHLGFPGRITRDKWREQARALAGRRST